MKFNIYDKKSQRAIIVVIAVLLALAMVISALQYLL